MKKFVSITVLTAATLLHAADAKKFFYDCEKWAEGAPPQEVFVVEGKITVASKDGNKALQIEPGGELVEANALLGDSANGAASIEARVFGSKTGRSFPRFGIGVHGQSGFRLMAFPAKKELQLVKGDEVVKSVPFDWKPDAWLSLKLDVKKTADGKWSMSGKAWPTDAAEPKDATITHDEATLPGQGKSSIWGTPFSGTPILFDDIKIEIE